MAIVRYRVGAAAIAPLLLNTVLVSPAIAQQPVGVNSAVNPEATGVPPGAVARRLVIGQEVVFNEHITTSAEGQTQILFLDQSSMTVGPNSDMVIDQFVYDPAAGTGKLAASLTRGVFRYVGGKLSKQDNAVTMQTPTATIGIRGGVVLVDLPPNGMLDVIFAYGKGVTVRGASGMAQTLTRPGFEVTVARGSAAPSRPSPAPQGQTSALLTQLDGRPGRTGGAHTVPTDTTVAKSGISAQVSGNFAASVEAANETQPPATNPADVSAAVRQSQWNLQIAANQGLPTSGPSTPPAPPPPPPTMTAAAPPTPPPPAPTTTAATPPAPPPPAPTTTAAAPPAPPPAALTTTPAAPPAPPPAALTTTPAAPPPPPPAALTTTAAAPPAPPPPPPTTTPATPPAPPPPSPPPTPHHHHHHFPPVVISYVGHHNSTVWYGITPVRLDRPSASSAGINSSVGPAGLPQGPMHRSSIPTTFGSGGLSTPPRGGSVLSTLPLQGSRAISPSKPMTGATPMHRGLGLFYANLIRMDPPSGIARTPAAPLPMVRFRRPPG